MPLSIEEKTRRVLPLFRFLQSCLPLPQASRLLKLGVRRVRLQDGVKREKVSADGVACEWIIPPNSKPDRVLLYLHGGGFVFGVTPQHLHIGAYLVLSMGLPLLMVDYRLAPQHPFPAALQDCVTAYRWLLGQGFQPGRIAIAGDSAGGNLVITTMLKLRADGVPLPAAGACLSPVTDLTEKGGNNSDFRDPLLPRRSVRYYTTSYLGGSDPHNPLVSPVYADLHGLPPLLVHVGEDEILRQDAIRITECLKAAGVEVRLEIYPQMWHVWQLFMQLPQAGQSLDDIASFLAAPLEPAPPRRWCVGGPRAAVPCATRWPSSGCGCAAPGRGDPDRQPAA